MNDLCTDIGYKSINHVGEQLCGDHVEIVEQEDGSTVIVLADGLGSGVKASILSTLTSKIISTMIAAGCSLEECVKTIVDTLPVRSEHGVAYSTFTIIRINPGQTAEVIQYDNPPVIYIHNDKVTSYPKIEMHVDGKKILRSLIRLSENDLFVMMSDGCPHAGTSRSYNYSWDVSDIAQFMAEMSMTGYTAKVLSTMLVEQCDKLYGGEPGDDATACVVKMRRRMPMNVLFGPPVNPDDSMRMAALFFSRQGKHIVCGGTTASIAAEYLHKPLQMDYSPVQDSSVPPMSKLEGADLVTEGVVTMGKVLSYAQDYLAENQSYEAWSFGHDGASRICQLLFEEATDIRFFVGRAVNPAHQNPNLPISIHVKMKIVEELSEYLRKMGKRVQISYY